MDKQNFYVTFGIGHPLAGYYVIVKAKNWEDAYNTVKIQFVRYGEIYTQDEWDRFNKKYNEPYDKHYDLKQAAVIDFKYVCNYEDYKD